MAEAAKAKEAEFTSTEIGKLQTMAFLSLIETDIEKKHAFLGCCLGIPGQQKLMTDCITIKEREITVKLNDPMYHWLQEVQAAMKKLRDDEGQADDPNAEGSFIADVINVMLIKGWSYWASEGHQIAKDYRADLLRKQMELSKVKKCL